MLITKENLKITKKSTKFNLKIAKRQKAFIILLTFEGWCYYNSLVIQQLSTSSKEIPVTCVPDVDNLEKTRSNEDYQNKYRI